MSLTPEARQQDVALALAEDGTSIRGTLEEYGRGVLQRAYAEVDQELGELAAVSPEELSEAERNLRTALGAASHRPELLLNLYRERHLRPGDRRIIEGAAMGMIDALGASDSYAFREQWNELQVEIGGTRGPEELTAVSHRAALDELAEYLEAARSLVGADLTLIDPSLTAQDRDGVLIRRAISEADVNRFQLKYAALSPASPAM